MEKKNNFYKLLIFSLVFLLNPNINVIDIMPDFIAWLVLARLFEKAADSAPYFEEARAGFIKLAYVNLAKILGLALILLVKSKDTTDNNIFALVSFGFAAVELLFLIPAVNNIFTALFHLGERTDAPALISRGKAEKDGLLGDIISRLISAESVRTLTYVFISIKALASTLPDFFLLTRETDKGHVVNFSKAYPIVLLLSFLVALIAGALWFIRVKLYADKVRDEGRFDSALLSMREEDKIGKYEQRVKVRSIFSLLTFISVASIFTVEISFSNFSGINILPHFLYLGLMLVAVFISRKHTSGQKIAYPVGALAVAVSTVSYVLTVSFLSRYSYEDIALIPAAKSAYLVIEILTLLETALTVAFLFLVMRIMNRFVLDNTGMDISSERYSKLEEEFHRSLKIKNLVIFIMGSLASLAKCASVFINSKTQIIFSDPNDVTMGAFAASVAPWFNLVVTGTAVIYIFFTFYYMSGLKDEVKMRYSDSGI